MPKTSSPSDPSLYLATPLPTKAEKAKARHKEQDFLDSKKSKADLLVERDVWEATAWGLQREIKATVRRLTKVLKELALLTTPLAKR